MANWAPKVGELVGYMISTPARNYSAHRTINERSNIVVQPWRDTESGVHERWPSDPVVRQREQEADTACDW